MIVRTEDGGLLIVSQGDHARLSGQFAASWGNELFAAPEPHESVLRAAAFHDCGWAAYDTRPLYDAAAGAPPTFLRVPFDAVQVAAHEDGIAWLTRIDAYAGLLMSRHRTGLMRARYGTLERPAPPPARELGPEAADFLARTEAAQAEALRTVDAAAFAFNYHLLQVWDVLSLWLCMGEPKATTIAPVPVDRAGVDRRALTLTPGADDTIHIDPYPFATRDLSVAYVFRRLDTAQYADQAAFRAAWFGASPQVRTFSFR